MVGKIRHLDKLIFSSWFLNDFGHMAVTRSAGREFQGMTTRFEKKFIGDGYGEVDGNPEGVATGGRIMRRRKNG